MQQQSAQNMYVSTTGTQQQGNTTNTIRSQQQQQINNLYHSTSAQQQQQVPPSQQQQPQQQVTNATTRVSTAVGGGGGGGGGGAGNGAGRHGPPLQAHYQQTQPQPLHHPNLVMQYPQFHNRQTHYAPAHQQYTAYPTMHPSFYNFFYSPIQAAPPPPAHTPHATQTPHQRGTVVTNSLAAATTAPPPPGTANPTPLQIPPGSLGLAAGAVPPSVTGPVLGVATATAAGQVNLSPLVSMVGNVVMPAQQPPPKATQQPSQPKVRKHTLKIIDPKTNKNILEDLVWPKDSSSSSTITNNESVIDPNEFAHDNQPQQHQQQLTISNGGVNPDGNKQQITHSTPSFLDVGDNSTFAPNVSGHQTHQQTPIVSALSAAPSVEILPSPQKPRNKKILPIAAPIEQEANEDTNYQDGKISSKVSTAAVPTANDISAEKTTTTPTTTKTDVEKKTNNTDKKSSSDSSTKQPSIPASNSNTTKNSKSVDIEARVISSTDVVTTDSSNSSSTSSQEVKDHQRKDDLTHIKKITTTAAAEDLITTSNNNSKKIEEMPVTKTNNNNSNKEQEEEDQEKYEKQQSKIINTEERNSKDKTDYKAEKKQEDKMEVQKVNDDVIDKIEKKEEDKLIIDEKVKEEKEKRVEQQQQQEEEEEEEKLQKSLSVNRNDNSSNNNKEIENKTQKQKEKEEKTITMMKSLIKYNEGQWSPENPDGKKQYGRDQLLQLREAKASKIQPIVKNVEILPSHTTQNPMMPQFARGNNNKRGQSMVGSIGGSNNNSGTSAIAMNSKQASMSGLVPVHSGRNSSMKRELIHIDLSLNKDVKLNETDNAWRPRLLAQDKVNSAEKLDKSDNFDEESRAKFEKEDLIRRVRGILNKLTPEKFDALVGEILGLKIDTQDKMQNVMELVFEKAIDEPNFSVSYARLCQRLVSEVFRRDEEAGGSSVLMESGTKSNLSQFRSALIDKTEKEFTQNVVQSAAKEQKLQPILDKIKKCKDPVERAELQALLEEEERKIRRRSGGTVRFIGELFKISMLTAKIIHSCIDTLLKPISEDRLECLCKLLTTVGAKFEASPINSKDPRHFYSLDKQIAQMQEIANNKTDAKISSRVRFMLQDVIDLRKNKWQSKRANEAPKTMQQIENETKSEQMSAQYLNYGPSSASSSSNSQIMANKRDDHRGGGSSTSRSSYNDTRSSSGNVYGGSHSQRGNRENTMGDTNSLRRQQQNYASVGGNSGSGGSSSTSNFGHLNANNIIDMDNSWKVQTKSGRVLPVDTSKLNLMNHSVDVASKNLGGVSQFQWMKSNIFAPLSQMQDSGNKTNNQGSRDRNSGSGRNNKGSHNKGSMERDQRYGGAGLSSSSRSSSTQASRDNSISRSGGGHQSNNNLSVISSSNTATTKSASHNKYSQQNTNANRNVVTKTSSATFNSFSRNATVTSAVAPANNGSSNYNDKTVIVARTTPPQAIFIDPFDDSDVKKNVVTDVELMKSVVTDIVESVTNAHEKTINDAMVSSINRIADEKRCGLIYYILKDYLHLQVMSHVSRRQLGCAFIYLIQKNALSMQHVHLAYEKFCESANDLILDVPELWRYIFEFFGPFLYRGMVNLSDLWHKKLRKESASLRKKFLKTFIIYCTREIGPKFMCRLWRDQKVKWQDFLDEQDIQEFIKTNKFEYLENTTIKPNIEKNISETYLKRVMEHVESLLKEGANADDIIDYLSGNVVEYDKQFVRKLTNGLCNFSVIIITDKEDVFYKLDKERFQKLCVPILKQYVGSNNDFELECLYAMQIFVHTFEHPRGLLNDLFAELYDNDVIPHEAFFKWRDSKDQSAGKGVAVKSLNPFFTQILSGETSDDNEN